MLDEGWVSERPRVVAEGGDVRKPRFDGSAVFADSCWVEVSDVDWDEERKDCSCEMVAALLA